MEDQDPAQEGPSSGPRLQGRTELEEADYPLYVRNMCNILQCNPHIAEIFNRALNLLVSSSIDVSSVRLKNMVEQQHCSINNKIVELKRKVSELQKGDRIYSLKKPEDPSKVNDSNKMLADIAFSFHVEYIHGLNKIFESFLPHYLVMAFHAVIKDPTSLKIPIDLRCLYKGIVEHMVHCHDLLWQSIQLFLQNMPQENRDRFKTLVKPIGKQKKAYKLNKQEKEDKRRNEAQLIQDGIELEDKPSPVNMENFNIDQNLMTNEVLYHVKVGEYNMNIRLLFLFQHTMHAYAKFRMQQAIMSNSTLMSKFVSYRNMDCKLALLYVYLKHKDFDSYPRKTPEFTESVLSYFELMSKFAEKHEEVKNGINIALSCHVPSVPIQLEHRPTGCYVYDSLKKLALDRCITSENLFSSTLSEFFPYIQFEKTTNMHEKPDEITDNLFDDCLLAMVKMENMYGITDQSVDSIIVHQFLTSTKDKKRMLLHELSFSDVAKFKAVITSVWTPKMKNSTPALFEEFYPISCAENSATNDNAFCFRTKAFERIVIPICDNFHFFCLFIDHPEGTNFQSLEEPSDVAWEDMCCYVVDSITRDEKSELRLGYIKDILSHHGPLSQLKDENIFTRMQDFEARYTQGERMQAQVGLTCGYHAMLNCLCLARFGRTYPIEPTIVEQLWMSLLHLCKIKGMHYTLDAFAKLLKPEVLDEMILVKSQQKLDYDRLSLLLKDFNKKFKDVTATYEKCLLPGCSFNTKMEDNMYVQPDFYLELWNQYVTTTQQYKNKEYGYTSDHWDLHEVAVPVMLCHGSLKDLISLCKENLLSNDLTGLHSIVLDYSRFYRIKANYSYQTAIDKLNQEVLVKKSSKRRRICFPDDV